MTVQIVPDFAEELRSAARSLREAGDLQMSRELRKGIADAARPVLGEIRDGMREYMPNRYADLLAADLNLTTSQRIAGKATAKVLIVGRPKAVKRRRLKRLDDGVLEHPLFGDRKRWFKQIAPLGGMHAGFFTGPVRENAARIRKGIREAMDRVAEDAARRY